MSRALNNVRFGFVPDPTFSSYGYCAVAVCLVVLLASPMWCIPSSRFSGLSSVLPTGSATMNLPSDIAVDSAGNVFIADTGNSQIVKVNPQGTASALTITGITLSFPTAITVDGSGTLYIADSGNNRIVTVTSSGAGTVVGTPSVTLSSPQGVALDQSGNLFIADTNNNRIVEVIVAGTASVFSITGLGTALNTPTGLAIDPSGNLYIADSVNSRIVKVAAGGTAGAALSISGLSTALDTPRGVAVDRLGTIYIADTNNNRVVTVTRAGAGSTLSTGSITLTAPKGMDVDINGAVYIADTSNNRAVTVASSAVGFGHLQLGTASGTTKTLPFTVTASTTLGVVKAFTVGTEGLDFTLGAGTTCTAGTTNATCTVDIKFLPVAPGLRKGAVVLYDNASTPSPVVTVPLYGFSDAPVAALAPNTAALINTGGVTTYYPFQMVLDGAGNMYVGNYVMSGTNPKVVKVAAGGGSASVVNTTGFTLGALCGIAMDGAGNLFLGDHANDRIIVVMPAGVASQLAISGLTLGEPTELAFDAAGNLFIADYSPNARIVEVSSVTVAGATSSGVGTVLATGSYTFTAGKLSGVAVGVDGTVYIASGTDNSSHVVQVTATGVASLVSPSGLSFLNPQGATVDGMGNLYIADSSHNRIVEITTSGVASVVSVPGLTGPSTLAAIYGITADAFGNVYIPDWTNSRLVYLGVGTASLSFASTRQGLTSSDSPKTATVTNVGNLPLVFSADPTYTNDFSEDSAITNACDSSTSLAAGTVCNVTVDFTPQSVGGLSTNITVTNNTQNVTSSTQVIAVSGTGLTPGDTTAVAVGGSAASVDIGQSFTITATVTDTAAGHTSTVPTGGVTFIDTVDSTAVSLNGGSAVTLSNGVATLTGVTLSGSGSHTITASYAGVSGTFQASCNTGAVYVRDVPTVALTSSANPALLSTSVTFTATVSSGSGTPTGSVNFYDGTTRLGTVTLASGTARYATSSLTIGSHSVTAAYGGDTQFSALTSSAISQIVSDRAIPTVTLASSANPSLLSTSVTFTATVSSGSGTPTGSVNFYDGATLLGSATLASGKATYATTHLAKGTHSVTAAYAGDTQFATLTSSAVLQAVSDFNLAVASGGSASATVAAGGTATYSLTIGPSEGTTFPATATLTATGAPTGSVVTITPSSLAAGDRATNIAVTIKVPAQSAALYVATAMGTGLAPIMAGILLLPWGGRRRRRSGTRGFMACGLFLVLITAGSLVGCGTNTHTITTQPKNYTVTLTATSGTVTNSAILHLTVQ